MRRQIGLFALAAAAALGAVARDVTGLVVADGTVTVTLDAGSENSTNAIYFAWNNLGTDSGSNPSAWENILRIGLVPAEATSHSFELPTLLTGQFACRVFLASTTNTYDHLLSEVQTTGKQWVNTQFCASPKTVAAMDFQLTKTQGQQRAFGTSASSAISGTFSYDAYINGSSATGGAWACACNDGKGAWAASSVKATLNRIQVRLDATVPSLSITQNGDTTTKKLSLTRTITSAVPLYLFARYQLSSATTGAFTSNGYGSMHFYSLVITNDGVCVRHYLPCMKDGVAGLYDAVQNTVAFSGSTTALVASGTNVCTSVVVGDEILSPSPVWIQANPNYVTDTPFVETLSLTFDSGGSKGGAAPLTFSGENTWGGPFTVYEGTLVADFGQGLATTDNLVLNGGTYCPLASDTFAGTIGTAGGQLSVAPDAEAAGFSAYGHPVSISFGNSETPISYGPSSNPRFNPATLILNDSYATHALTLENGIAGDGTSPTLTIQTSVATATVARAVTGVDLVRTGDGTLILNGCNEIGSFSPQKNSQTVFMPAGGAESATTQFTNLVLVTDASVFFSNAVVSAAGVRLDRTGAMTMTDTVFTGATFRVGFTNETASLRASLKLDHSTFVADKLYCGRNAKFNDQGKTIYGDMVLTNDTSVTVDYFNGAYGKYDQYGGTVNVTNEFHLGTKGAGGPSWRLYGGRLSIGGTFRLGESSIGGDSPTGYLSIYDGDVVVKAQTPTLGYYYRFDATEGPKNDGNHGRIYVYGGTFTVERAANDATFVIGREGTGELVVRDGGIATIQGGISMLTGPKHAKANAKVSVLTNGVLTTKWLRAVKASTAPTNYVSTLILNGGRIVAQANSEANFISNLTVAAVGPLGTTFDTAGQNVMLTQDFAPWGEIEEDEGETAAALAAAPAFTKVGAGTLTLHGTNTYLCATCVSNGTLAVTDAQSLPATTTLRVATNAVVDLSEKSHTVANLMGGGLVTNGTLAVTGTVWPGYPDAGTLTVNGATLAPAKLAYVLGEDGTCGKLAVNGPLDLTGVEITVDNLANKGKGSLTLVTAGSITGTPTCNQPDVVLCVTAHSLRLGAVGMTVIIR